MKAKMSWKKEVIKVEKQAEARRQAESKIGIPKQLQTTLQGHVVTHPYVREWLDQGSSVAPQQSGKSPGETLSQAQSKPSSESTEEGGGVSHLKIKVNHLKVRKWMTQNLILIPNGSHMQKME